MNHLEQTIVDISNVCSLAVVCYCEYARKIFIRICLQKSATFELKQLGNHILADENVPLVRSYTTCNVTLGSYKVVKGCQHSSLTNVNNILLSTQQITDEEAATLCR